MLDRDSALPPVSDIGAREPQEEAPEPVIAGADTVRMGPGERPTRADMTDDALFEEGIIHDIYLALDEDAISSLGDTPDVDVMAKFGFDQYGAEIPVGVHLKGTSSFRTLSGKAAFKIDFHEWNPEARFHGRKRITLNNMAQDATMLHEHVYYWLCGELGLPAPRHSYARVWVNDEPYGLYGLLETMDEQFIDRVWPNDDKGTLYEGEAGNDFTEQRGDFGVEELGLPGFEVEALIATVLATPPDQYLAMLEANFDVDALFGYWAVDIITGNVDGYALNFNNFFVYGAPKARRWTLVPAGTDRSFVDATGGIRGSGFRRLSGALVLGCLDDPACVPRLDARIREVIDAWDALDVPGVAAAMVAVVGPECEADPKRDRLCRSAEILDFIGPRAAKIRADLDEEED
ncbi:MAG: CotH kinase family protein [Pseudomonadota bacterium]|nr:CotH kinase family protein [Pseudomonadota bacterium]